MSKIQLENEKKIKIPGMKFDKPAPHPDKAEENLTPMVDIDRVSFFYEQAQALKNISMSISKNKVTAFAALPEPAERPGRGGADGRGDPHRRPGYLSGYLRRQRFEKTGWHGVSEIQPVSQDDF
jgi:hypothetical protein